MHRLSSSDTFSASHHSPLSPENHPFRCLCRFLLGLIDLYSNVDDDNDGDASVDAALCFPSIDCVSDNERLVSIVYLAAGVEKASKSLNNQRWKIVNHSAAATALLCF